LCLNVCVAYTDN